MDKWRGHNIELNKTTGNYQYLDTKELVCFNPHRACGYCDKANTEYGHDGCLGDLDNVINACCGHGSTESAYLVFKNGIRLDGADAIKYFSKILGSEFDNRNIIY